MEILFLQSSGLPSRIKNQNLYQRALVLGKLSKFKLFLRKGVECSEELKKNLYSIQYSKCHNKFLFLIEILYKIVFTNCYARTEIILTEASYLSIAGLIGKLFGKKWVLDIWDIPFRNTKTEFLPILKNKIYILIFRPLFRCADLIIVVSILANFGLKKFMLQEHKFLRCHNSIFLDETKPMGLIKFKVFTILVMRSVLTPNTGIDIALMALSKVLESIDAQLIIIGKPTPNILEKINHFKYPAKLIITGLIEHTNLIQLIDQSHVCIIPFHNTIDLEQTYPIKTYEYLAMGKAVIASRLSGISEIISDGFNGLLVEPENPDDLADAILKIYNNNELKEMLEKNARHSVIKYDAVKKNKQIYEKLKTLF